MPLMTVREIAARLHVSQSFVYALLESGRLKHHVLGRGHGGKRVSEKQLQEYLQETEHGGIRAPEPEPSVARSTFKHMKV